MTFEQLDEQLQKVAEHRRRLVKLRRDERTLLEQLGDARQARRTWQDAVEHASEDLRKLEGVSLTAMFRTLLGNRRERIDDERERLLQAKLRHDECEAAIGPLEQRLQEVRAETQQLGDVDARREQLLASKERVLRERGGDAARRLVDSAEHLGELHDRQREAEQAVAAGRDALLRLQAAESDLAGARSWGAFDLMGGGAVSSLMKHSRIDKARANVERAQRDLRTFVREIGDVGGIGANLSIDIGGFAKFADVFFDSLISDWFVQSKIGSATERVRVAKREVQRLVNELERRIKQLAAEQGSAREQRRRWIEQAD